MPLRVVTLDELTIDDDAALKKIGLYRRLKRHLRDTSYRFRVADPEGAVSWDRALFLNLTFWTPGDGADVLCSDHIAADVVAHVGWHHVVQARLTPAGATPTAAALFFAEAIASAFDLYLVGRLLENDPDSDFITSQVPIMADVAQQAGLPEGEFEALLQGIHQKPEKSFEDLRALLFDVTLALYRCDGVGDALAALDRVASHRFAPLLHHFELSNWVLYARAHARPDAAQDAAVMASDDELRRAPCSLDWLDERWVPLAD